MVFDKEKDKAKPYSQGENEVEEIVEERYYEDSNTKRLSPNSIFSKKKSFGGG